MDGEAKSRRELNLSSGGTLDFSLGVRERRPDLLKVGKVGGGKGRGLLEKKKSNIGIVGGVLVLVGRL